MIDDVTFRQEVMALEESSIDSVTSSVVHTMHGNFCWEEDFNWIAIHLVTIARSWVICNLSATFSPSPPTKKKTQKSPREGEVWANCWEVLFKQTTATRLIWILCFTRQNIASNGRRMDKLTLCWKFVKLCDLPYQMTFSR